MFFLIFIIYICLNPFYCFAACFTNLPTKCLPSIVQRNTVHMSRQTAGPNTKKEIGESAHVLQLALGQSTHARTVTHDCFAAPTRARSPSFVPNGQHIVRIIQYDCFLWFIRNNNQPNCYKSMDGGGGASDPPRRFPMRSALGFFFFFSWR